MVIIVLSPGWLGDASRRRGLALRLQIATIWGHHAELRALNAFLSALLRPLEACFPFVKTESQLISIGCRFQRLGERLRSSKGAVDACLMVPKGEPFFLASQDAQIGDEEGP